MQKQEKETKKPKENKKKHKRKVSIFTILLWLFLITTMSTITIGTFTKKNAIEIPDNNWNIQLVMYDRNSGTPNQAITDFTWNATGSSAKKQLTMQMNYACTTGKAYSPGEIIIEVSGFGKNGSESNQYYYPDTVIAADKEESSEKQYDWSYRYDEENNIYVFTNNTSIAENEHFEGTIQIVYELKPCFKIQTDLEFQAKIKENIEADEIIAMESNICNFHYTSIKKGYTLEKNAEVAPKEDYTPIKDILDNYYWIKYSFSWEESDSAIISAYTANSKSFRRFSGDENLECIKEQLPEGCVLYDQGFNKIEPREDNMYYYLAIDSYYYVGYPKTKYNEGDSITNIAELWGRYEDEEEIQKLSEDDITVNLVEFDFEYKGELYDISKDLVSHAVYLNSIKSKESEEAYWLLNEIKAFYTDSIMDVEIGDDLLYITRESGEITKLEDNEYHFIGVAIPVFYTYNKYTGIEGDKLIGYEWELQVRYANTNEYVTYKTGITGEGKVFLLPNGFYTLNDCIAFENEDVVGIKVIIKDLDKTLYNNAEKMFVYTNIHTQDCAVGKIYNFDYIQVYHKNEEGNRTLVNEPTLDSYSAESAKLKVAEYDQETYGTYMQRAYKDINIDGGGASLSAMKESYFKQNNVAEEKYTCMHKLKSELYINHYEINKDVILKTYDILPEGIYLGYNREEIINNLTLFDQSNAYNNLKLKDGTAFATKQDLEEYIKENTEIEIDYNYKDSGRTKISIITNLNEIDWSYYLTHRLQLNDFYISYNIQVEIPYESILEYGTSYTNYVYSMWNNQEYDYGRSTSIDNGKYDSLAIDIDQDGDTTEKLTYAERTLNIIHAVASHQAVIKQVRTDLTQGRYVEGTAEVSAGGEYDYKLRVTTGANSIKDLILYDNIETILDENGADISEGWKGSFLGVDTSYAESKGYAPKVYYSTELNPGKLTEVPDKWLLLDDSVDKSIVKSICVDLRYKEDGSEMELNSNSVVFVLVKMQAPDDKNLMTSANNMFWTNWRAIDPLGTVIDNVEGIYSNQVNVEISKKDIVKEISGRKIWEDNENALGLRPASIVVKLMQDGTEYAKKTVTEADNWNYTFENVPVYRDNVGNEFVYTIEEEAVTNYKIEISGNDITNEINKTEIEVEKKWVGDEGSSRRPEKVTIQLKKGGVLLEEKEANESNNWKVTFTNIDKYDDNGDEIVYTVDEKEDLEFYTKAVVGNVITNTFTVPDDKIQITGIKSWNDNNNEAGKRPSSLMLQVKNGDLVVAEQEVSETTNWQYTFELPKYDSLGNEIVYTIDEKDSGSKFYVKEKIEGYTVINKFEVPNETVEVTVEKKWNDNDNEAGKRPSSITLQVKEGEKIVQEQVVSANENWKYTFTNLPKYDSLGNEINYTVDEKENLKFYTKGIVGNVITNTFTVPDEKTSIIGEKVWDDDNNKAEKRPSSIVLQVKNGEEVVASQTVTEANNWTYTFEGLKKYDRLGNEIQYTIDEENTNSIFYQKENTSSTVVTNTFVVPNDTVKIVVQKTWNDNNDKAGKRPESIVLQVKANNKVVGEYEVTSNDQWSHTFELPKYDELGNEIIYTVDEKETPEFYTKTVVGNTITNTFEVPGETVSITGEKKWNDNNNEAEKRPNNIVLVVKDGNQVVARQEVNEQNNWKYTFTNLPKYDENADEIHYVIDEESTNSIFYQKENTSDTVVTNTFVVPNDKIEIEAEKKWVGDEGTTRRPESITLQIKNGNEVVQEQVVTEKENWKHTFTNLPKYDNLGNEIVYTVDEKETSEFYAKTVLGNVVTNTFTVPDDKIKIVGQKEWQDNENEAGKRPESVTLQVKANGAVVTEAEVNENNLWRYEFTVPKYDSLGNEIEYSIDEREIGNKFYQKIGVEENVVINKFVVPDEKVQIKVQKSWDDNDDEAEKRPESIILQVKNGEIVVAEAEVSETTNWEYTFELPKYNNLGNEISYTVDETFESEFYVKNIVGNVITNKFVVPEDRITIVGTKEWNDNDNLAEKRPESVILQIKNGETVVAEAEVSEKTNWSYSFDLAKYDNLGNEINYTLSERIDSIFYEKETVENTDMFNQKVVNKFVVPNEQVLVKAVKKWEDNNDEYGKRPNSVVLQVLVGDEVVAEQKVTESDSWSYSFKLPKYDSLGNEIEYSVDEKETAEYYEKSIDGYTIVNTCTYEPPVDTSDISIWVYVVVLVVAVIGISGVFIVRNRQKKNVKKV